MSKILWLMLFVLGIWLVNGVFIGWGWSSFVSLLASAFVVGAILQVGKFALAGLAYLAVKK